jgi:hypothetical protein
MDYFENGPENIKKGNFMLTNRMNPHSKKNLSKETIKKIQLYIYWGTVTRREAHQKGRFVGGSTEI